MTESKEKSKIKRRWNKIKEKMDELVKLIDEIKLERIQGHAQEIDRVCNTRNIRLMKPRKDVKKRKKNKWIKMKENCDCGDKIMTNKQWIANIDEQQEEQ